MSSIFAGCAIFAVIGYMANMLGTEVKDVAADGELFCRAFFVLFKADAHVFLSFGRYSSVKDISDLCN